MSIFILAPLSAAAPYQYQTGNPKELVKSIFTVNDNNCFNGRASEIVEKFRTTGDYYKPIIEKIHSVQSSLKMIAFGNNKGKYYYYLDEHWATPVKRPIFDYNKIEAALGGIYNKAFSNENYINKSLDEKRHAQQVCGEANGCSVLLYRYGDDSTTDQSINIILKKLFISKNEVNKDDYILLKRGVTEWYIAVIKNGVEPGKAWRLISPQLCGVNHVENMHGSIYTQSEDDFISICYTSKVKNVVMNDVQYLCNRGYRIWYDEQLNGVETWLEQVKKRILEPKCHRVIIYISRDLYADESNIPDEKDDGLYQEIKFIYEYNKKNPQKKIDYLVVLVGAESNNDIGDFKGDLLRHLWQHRQRSDIIEDVLFTNGRLHGIRSSDPYDILHFETADNKCYITLFSDSGVWKNCREKGE